LQVKTCANLYATSESFLSKVALKSDLQKKTFRCVIGFRFHTEKTSTVPDLVTDVDVLSGHMEDLYAASSQRAVTGTLSSHPDCRDVHIDSLSITFHGTELLVDTRLELNNGRRYGLIGLNGCGQ